MLSESLLRVLESFKNMESTWPGLICLTDGQKVSIAFPRDNLWFDVVQQPSLGFEEVLSVEEFNPRDHQTACVRSAWEAVTTITQRMLTSAPLRQAQ